MQPITDAWVIQEPTTGDSVKIGYKQGDKEKMGAITGTALHLLQLKAKGDEAALNGFVLRAVQRFVERTQGNGPVFIGTPLDLG